MKNKIATTFLMLFLVCSSVIGQELIFVIFSVNSADATLIVFPTGKTMMVDSGTEAMNISRVIPFLERHGIDHLDYYVDTHPHKDHYGGRAPLISAGIIDGNTKAWNSFKADGIAVKHAQVYYNKIDEGSKPLLYGSQFEMEGTNWFICNREDVDLFETANANVNSLAFRMEYNGFTYSHGGDEARLSMNRYLKDYPELVEVDVRNTAHHMRGPINQDYFIATNPDLWIISNIPGMSANKTTYNLLLDTVELLEGNGKKHEVLITGDVGHVIIRAKGKNDWSYQTSLDYTNGFFDFIKSDTYTPPEPVEQPDYLDDSDALTGWKCAGGNVLSLNTSDKKQGAASLEMTGKDGQEFFKVFSPAYNAQSSADNTVLKFSYYVSDVSLMSNDITIEISSSGAADRGEYNWKVNKTELVNGWNDLELKVSDARKTLGSSAPMEPNLSAINWFRLFGGKTDVITTRIDGIQLRNEDDLLAVKRFNKATVKIYPNPNDELLHIVSDKTIIKVSLFNSLGKQVLTVMPNNDRASLDVSQFKPGVYFVHIEDTNSQVQIQELLVE